MSEKRLLTAAYVAPMNGPVLRDAGVVYADGLIVAVGGATLLRRDHPEAAVEDLGSAVLLPGLVNPHTHLELSSCLTAGANTGTFTDWIAGMSRRLQVGERPLDEVVAAGVTIGVAQCVRFGVTSVGDISKHHHVTRPLLRDGPLRCVSYGEALGLAKARERFERQVTDAIDGTYASARLRVGLTPHAPYTVDLPGYRKCLAVARERGVPLATHLAESADETEFLVDHAGPFRAVWDALVAWAEPVETFHGPPLRMAAAVGLLDHPTLLAHVNYCDDAELALLADGRASVVYCPRTHAYFGHPPHRWRDMLAAGVNVAIGTDSCASSPDLNLVDDLRFARRLAPEVPADRLWEMVTVRAAKAVEMGDVVGSLTAAMAADFVAFDVRTDDPLREVLDESIQPSRVWVAGALTGSPGHSASRG